MISWWAVQSLCSGVWRRVHTSLTTGVWSEIGTSRLQIWLLIPALVPSEPPFPHPSGASSSPGTAAVG